MLFNKRILVALDGGSHCVDAIHRAQMMATKTGCELEILWFGNTSAWQPLEEEIKELESTCRVSRQVSTTHMLDSVKEIWQEDHFTLLIKGCDREHNTESLLAPTDWKLLRETPCPVLLVKQQKPWTGGRVLAAINPLSSEEHQSLHDRSVLMLAAFIASEENAELQAVVATPAPMQMAEPEDQIPELIEQRARAAADKMLKNMNLKTQQLHIGEGPAEYLIAQVAGEQDAALVVISSSARNGIKGALLGNTAEQILDRLDTDVLVLRPGLAEQMPVYH
ncbi:MAG: universal stress protein [Amphritea sp.]